MSPFLLLGLTSASAPVVAPTQSEAFRVSAEDRVLAFAEDRRAVIAGDERLLEVEQEDRRTVVEQQPRRVLH